MAPGPETLLVGRIRKAILREFPGAFVVKTSGGPYQSAGLPDLLVIVYGRAVGLEVKARGPNETEAAARGRETLRQQAVRRRMTRAGAVCSVVLSVDEALAVVRSAADGVALGSVT